MVSTAEHNIPAERAEWIKKFGDKMKEVFTGQLLPAQLEEETKSKICCLPRRRCKLFQSKEDPFWPKVVRIGPFRSIEEGERLPISVYHKWTIVKLMTELYPLEFEWSSCLIKMIEQVPNVRKWYYDTEIPHLLGSENDYRFAEMLLLDSCFILFMLIIKIEDRPPNFILTSTTPYSERMMLGVYDKNAAMTRVLKCILNKDSIAPDLLILGNQIPFFVIEELFKKLDLDKPLHKYALEYFETIHPLSIQDGPNEEREDQNSPPEFLHLLDLFHWSRVPEDEYKELSSSPGNQVPYSESCHIPSAMELRQSGATFEKKMFGSSLDITFRKHRFIPIIRVLDIPELHIRSYSELVFHNLIAFEQHVSSKGRRTITFAALMGNLLQSGEDVKLLRQHGILVSSSTNDSNYLNIFKLIENQQMPIDPQQMRKDLSIICHEVQSYYDSVVSRFFRFFRVVILLCFSNPMVTFSLSVAALSLVPSVVQTIYSMLSYIHR